MTKKRLAKYLAEAGVAARRKCEELIFAGQVKINGQTVLLPQTLVDGSEAISVGNKKIGKVEEKVYFILNKPAGYLCSASQVNPKSNSRLVLDLFGNVSKRLFTVGRLDKDTTGLLLVTNDGAFANQVIHPSSNIHKEYIAKTGQEITDQHLKTLSQGADVEGSFVKPLKVQKVRRGTVKIIVGEGKKREVRALLEAADLDVKELKRVRIGGLSLGTLPIGSWRVLTEKEKELIFQ